MNIPIVGEFRLNLDDISLDDLDVSSTQSGIFLGANESLVITVTGATHGHALFPLNEVRNTVAWLPQDVKHGFTQCNHDLPSLDLARARWLSRPLFSPLPRAAVVCLRLSWVPACMSMPASASALVLVDMANLHATDILPRQCSQMRSKVGG